MKPGVLLDRREVVLLAVDGDSCCGALGGEGEEETVEGVTHILVLHPRFKTFLPPLQTKSVLVAVSSLHEISLYL